MKRSALRLLKVKNHLHLSGFCTTKIQALLDGTVFSLLFVTQRDKSPYECERLNLSFLIFESGHRNPSLAVSVWENIRFVCLTEIAAIAQKIR
jgi:hypothetical protein